MAIIEISICLSDIPESARKKAENGKWYTNLVVADRKEVDKYGNTHTVYCKQSKEDRKSDKPKHYIGNGKEVVFKKETPNQPVISLDANDLPF